MYWSHVKEGMPGVDGQIKMDGKTGGMVLCERMNAWSGWQEQNGLKDRLRNCCYEKD